MEFAWQSTINPQFWEAKYVKSLRYKGRGQGTTLKVDLAYKDSPDDEAAYQALTTQDVEFTLNNGTKTLKIDLNTNNVWSTRTRNLDYSNVFMWQGTLRNGWDKAAGADLAVSGT